MFRSARLLLLSQLSFWLFLVLCLLLMPHFLLESDEGGVSNYGVYTKTIIPFTLAFGLCGVLMLEAAEALPRELAHHQTLQRYLYSIGGLNLVVLESTYTYQVNSLFDGVHVYASVMLLVAEVVAGMWLWRVYTHGMLQTVGLCLLLTGFCFLVLTFFGLLHVLFIAETVASAGFSVLLVWTVGHAPAT
jgi:hypothetical protein